MAPIPGGVRFTGFVSPSDSADDYPVIDPIYGKGGYREVSDLIERDAITNLRRRIGMMVYVQSDNTLYYLKDGTTNLDWQELTVDSVTLPETLLAFGDSSDKLSSDANLYWDNVNKRLHTSNLVLTTTVLGGIVAGNLEYDGTNLYFSSSAVDRAKVLLEQFSEGQNISFGTVTGTQIGTSPNEKLSFYGSTPIAQPGNWTYTNAIIQRNLDAQDLTIDDIGNVLCTIIQDLKDLGLFG